MFFLHANCAAWVRNLVSYGGGNRLRVFQNRVLRRIFGPKREEDGSWRKLHNDELHSLYSAPNIVGVTCGTHGGGERCLQRFGWEA
jgi:hypothetical protein